MAALVAVGSLGRSVERTVAASGKTMMGGDVEIRSSQPLSPAAVAEVAARERAGARSSRIRELADVNEAAHELMRDAEQSAPESPDEEDDE